MSRQLFLASYAVGLLLAAPHLQTAQAINVFWQAGVADWSAGGSWTPGEPTAVDVAFLGNGGTAQITSAGEVAEALNIGHSSANLGNGILDISSGDLTLGGDLFLGSAGSRTGEVNQTGGDVTIGGDLRMAFAGGAVGNYDFSGGTLTFSGASNILMHRDSSFTHNVAGHTLAVPGNFEIGNVGAGTATVNIDQGTIDVSGDLILGTNQNNLGLLNIAPGASLVLSGGASNFNMRGESLYTNDNGHVLTVPGFLDVGSATGKAVFNLESGTVDVANDLRVAVTGSTEGTPDEFNFNGGTLTLSGVSSDLLIGRTGTFNHNAATTTSVSGNLHVGSIGAGTATFNLQQGTVDVAGDVILGTNLNNVGLLNISPGASLVLSGGASNFNMRGESLYTNDNGHVLTVPGFLDVGSATGKAVFNLESGTVDVANDLRIAVTGSTEGIPDEFNFNGGTLTLSGASSNLLIGRTGTFNHNAATTTSIAGNLHVGSIGAGVATFNLQQGTVDVSGDVILGTNQNNFGALNISPGASLVLSGGASNFNMRGESLYTNDNGHVLTVPGFLDVGSATGKAVFNLESGTVDVANDLRIAVTGSTEVIPDEFNYNGGTLTLSGASSNLLIGRTGTFNHNAATTTSIAGNLHVGSIGAGTATFNLLQGTVDVSGDVRIGTNQNNDGIVTISPGAQLVLSGGSSNFTMLGTGTFTNPAGHSFNVPGNMTIGSSAGSSVYIQNGGNVTVDGNFLLANSSTGTDEFRLNGGSFSLNGASTFNIGREGTATVNGGTLNAPGNMNVGSINVADPSIVNQNGGLVHVGGNLSLATGGATSTGDYNLLGGTLQVDGTLNLEGPGTKSFVLDGGTLAATTIDDASGIFDWQSGRLTPGALGTPGILTYNGTSLVIPTDGIVHFDLAAVDVAGGPNDLLVVPGDLTLGGMVTVNPLPSFEGVGSYPIIQVFGNLIGDESSLGVPGPSYSIEFIDFGEFTQINLVLVPEPSTMGLFSLGACVIAVRRQRRRRRSGIHRA